MIMESRQAIELEKEDDTNSSTECADDDEEEVDDEDEGEERRNESNTNDVSELTVPSNFICPLTLEIMKDPLISRHGQSYERRAIMEWIHQGNATCPMTRQPLRLSGLITNHALKKQIEQWKKENHYKSQNETNKETSGATSLTNDKKTKKKTKKCESTERILGMYCNFMEETTDRSRDDPPMILEWRRPASFDDDDNEVDGRRSTRSNNSSSTNHNNTTGSIRNIFTRFRSKRNQNQPTTMV